MSHLVPSVSGGGALSTGAAAVPASTDEQAAPPGRLVGLAGPLQLVGAAGVFLILQLVYVGVNLPAAWDEAVYLSQVNPSTPALYWGPQRAWGTAILFAPVSVFSPGPEAIRIYGTLLASVLLVVAFWPWLRIFRGIVVTVAALLFATFWATIYHGSQVMPNLYVALAAVAAAGWFVRTAREPRSRRLYAYLAASVVALALLRPSDSLLVVMPLAVAALVGRRWRRPWLVATVVVAEVIGWLPWIIESYVRFHDPLWRLQRGESAGARGVHPGLATARVYLDLLGGRFNAMDARAYALRPAGPAWIAWLCLIAVAVAAGVIASRRTGLAEVVVPTAAAGAFFVFYVFLLTYGFIRFLLPMLALAAIPAAVGLVAVAEALPRPRLVGTALLVALAAANFALQLPVLSRVMAENRPWVNSFADVGTVARAAVRQPCLLLSTSPVPPKAYAAGCQAASAGFGPGAAQQARDALSGHEYVVAVLPVTATKESLIPAPWFDTWRRAATQPIAGWVAYLPPATSQP